jgi:hypothetical protein
MLEQGKIRIEYFLICSLKYWREKKKRKSKEKRIFSGIT